MLNYSRNATRRITIVVGIGYGEEIDKALGILNNAMNTENRVLPSPAPEVFVDALDDSSVNLGMRCWANNDDYWPALYDLRKQAKTELDKAGISIPFPQRDVHLIKDGDA